MLSKILITIQNPKSINDYKKYNINNFAYPLEKLAVGFDRYFKISDIKEENSYIIINKVLNSVEINYLNKIKNDIINSKIKGILFSDLGVYELFKETSIRLIWNNIHFTTNSKSINYFEDIFSVIISNDLHKEEVNVILHNSKKPLIVNLLGHNMLSYSRRHFVKNYNKNYNKKLKNKVNIKDKITKKTMLVYDEEESTTIFSGNIVNNISLINQENILFYFINTFNLDETFILKYLEYLKNQDYTNTFALTNNIDTGFLEEKISYKIKGEDND